MILTHACHECLASRVDKDVGQMCAEPTDLGSNTPSDFSNIVFHYKWTNHSANSQTTSLVPDHSAYNIGQIIKVDGIWTMLWWPQMLPQECIKSITLASVIAVNT